MPQTVAPAMGAFIPGQILHYKALAFQLISRVTLGLDIKLLLYLIINIDNYRVCRTPRQVCKNIHYDL
ncbi:hypothetical protein PS706_00959 [Pseudomonas fluorescens]|nr:hypothetical protein PS706_00959 [Pseudomonas fluorescens]